MTKLYVNDEITLFDGTAQLRREHMGENIDQSSLPNHLAALVSFRFIG
jgi:hypothetical protein